jgi:hypothetical protein
MANMASNLGAKLKLVQIFATLIKVGMLWSFLKSSK